MGSKFSKSNNEEVKLESKYWDTSGDNDSTKNKKFDIDAYSSSQTQENTDSTMLSIKQEITENKNIKNIKNNETEKLYPFKFEWKGSGSVVVLAGSFLNDWKEFKQMVKNEETQIFELIVELPKKIHYFKFIVDNKWVCSSQYQTIMDNSHNQNNYIDLTKYIPPKDLVKKEEKAKKGKKNANKKKVIVLDMNDVKSNNYNCKYPLLHELNSSAPCVFSHYKPSFNIDYQSNQDKINAKYGFNFKEKNPLTENNTYKKILICPHEKLMHFCQNINDLNDTKKRYMKGCATIRNRHKYLTVIYYKPKPKKDNETYNL